ncbi:cytochrome P450 [Desarmillaria ectypa]|nr:cytochrome P450 [Desarmillaria ectypa]
MSSFLPSLILALTAFPEAQRKAQEEMDRVLGDQRIPTLDDFANLPYIQAVIKEYRGYTIPKGATVLTNTWGMFHDPDAFENPEVFDPGRYLLTEHGTKPGVDDHCYWPTLAFGNGSVRLQRVVPPYSYD